MDMKHRYLLIEAGREIDDSSLFVVLWCGQSKQADRDYLYVMSHAVTNGYYFELWSETVAEFYLGLISAYPQVRVVVSSIRDYVRSCKRAASLPPVVQQYNVRKPSLIRKLNGNGIR